MTEHVTAQIHDLVRLNNTRSGNPRWRLITKNGGSFETADDTMSGYAITPRMINTRVELTLNDDGQITEIKARS